MFHKIERYFIDHIKVQYTHVRVKHVFLVLVHDQVVGLKDDRLVDTEGTRPGDEVGRIITGLKRACRQI